MTRPIADVEFVFNLASKGFSKKAIARSTGVSRAAIRSWLERGFEREVERRRPSECNMDCRRFGSPADYSYLLGAYLGDGLVSIGPKGVFRLRLFCDSRYPGIIASWQEAVRRSLPIKGSLVFMPFNMVVVSAWSKHWPHLFPQHGPGMKHTRKIELEPWQQAIVEEHPREFIRGLIESDGCRVVNKVKQRRYSYTRYFFANESSDILELFGEACDRIGVEWRYNRPNCILVAKRDSVELLDTFIGPKR